MNTADMTVDEIAEQSMKRHRAKRVEKAAKAIFWCMNTIMHDHEAEWRRCLNQKLYRECAEAALNAEFN